MSGMNIRIIEAEQITNAVAELCVKANTCLGDDIQAALIKARKRETLPLAQTTLDTLLKNAEVAASEKLPICQDTGMAVVFVTIGENVHISGDISGAINEGVRRGYKDGYCRNSVVSDPLRRINTGDNTPSVIHYEFDGNKSGTVEITVAPKGFGSENMGGTAMLKPSDGADGIEDYVIGVVKSAGANPCPPVIVGVGIGGTAEKAALLSKKALLRKVGSSHPDSFWAETEARLLAKINGLGIGPAGFGGKTTALALHIMTYPTHIAGLPVAVNIGCHATRHQTTII
ncbi:MAG: fumarate hydratase [Oscillospiraceae bacterium]|nr:fumarate hydratase [Oscillospiraceae bacterium]